jgi:hypothetical protein
MAYQVDGDIDKRWYRVIYDKRCKSLPETGRQEGNAQGAGDETGCKHQRSVRKTTP